MKTKKVLTATSVAILALVFASQAFASGHQVFIYPIFGNTYTIGEDQVGVLRHGWAATTVGSVHAWIARVNQDFTLAGPDTFLHVTNDEAKSYWGPVTDFDFSCDSHQSNSYVSYWIYELPTLAPGTYELHFVGSAPGQFTDGCDYDGNGTPDHFPTGWEANITIIQE